MPNCGECTACCKQLELHEIPSRIGEYCEMCDPGKGCKIYNDRPNECREFRCMWHQMEKVGPELRPDLCNVIFDRVSDDVIVGRLEEGKKLSTLVMGQINAFQKQGFSVMIFRGKDMKPFALKNHSLDYLLEAIRGRAELH